MPQIVSLRTEVVHRFVFELRYEAAFEYWDRSGRIASHLTEAEGWEVTASDANHCELKKGDQNLVFSFGPHKLHLAQSQNEEVREVLASNEFATLADHFTDIVMGQLDFPHPARIGFRVWKLYPTASRDEAEDRVRRLKFCRLDAAVPETLGVPSEASCSLVVERPKHMLRLGVAPFEQQVNLPDSLVRAARKRHKDQWKSQKKAVLAKMRLKRIAEAYPSVGVLLDLDAFIEEPPFPDALSVSEFVCDASDDFEAIKGTVLESFH